MWGLFQKGTYKQMQITNDIPANDVYKTLLHADIKDLEQKIDYAPDAVDLWVSIYNAALAVKQREVINNGGTY